MVQDGKCNVSFRVSKVALYEWMVVVDFFTVLLWYFQHKKQAHLCYSILLMQMFVLLDMEQVIYRCLVVAVNDWEGFRASWIPSDHLMGLIVWLENVMLLRHNLSFLIIFRLHWENILQLEMLCWSSWIGDIPTARCCEYLIFILKVIRFKKKGSLVSGERLGVAHVDDMIRHPPAHPVPNGFKPAGLRRSSCNHKQLALMGNLFLLGWGSKPNASRGSKPNAEC